MAKVVSENNEVLFLLQKIESIIDTRLIGEVEPLDDEIELIGEYQKRKSEGTLELMKYRILLDTHAFRDFQDIPEPDHTSIKEKLGRLKEGFLD